MSASGDDQLAALKAAQVGITKAIRSATKAQADAEIESQIKDAEDQLYQMP